MFSSVLRCTLFSLITLLIFSCAKSSNDQQTISGQKALVKIGIPNIIFEEATTTNKKSSSTNTTSRMPQGIQRSTIKWDDNFMLVTELNAVNSRLPVKRSSSTNRFETSNVTLGIRYRVYVYEEGRFITSRDYIRGEEDRTELLLLDAGKTYTFIAFTKNNNNPADLVDPARMGDRASFITDSDPMYFRKEMTLSNINDNYLNIDFRHLFGQIIITIDASATGQNITSLVMRTSGNSGGGDFNLMTGERLNHRAPTPNPPNWTNLNSPIVTSLPYMLSVAPNTPLSLSGRMYLGRDRKDKTLFNNMIVDPGIKYNMTVKIVPITEIVAP